MQASDVPSFSARSSGRNQTSNQISQHVKQREVWNFHARFIPDCSSISNLVSPAASGIFCASDRQQLPIENCFVASF
jgi:hypothetical protein